MNRRRSTAPLLGPESAELERIDSVPTSPARSALQSNLDSEPAVKKRNSWFDLRGSIQKSALTIKGAIDFVRGEQHGSNEDGLQRLLSEDSTTVTTHAATERPKTPVRPTIDRKNTFSPKSAVSSLRQHFPRHSSRQKRGSVHSVYYGTTSAPIGADGPERFSMDKQGDAEAATHSRRTSIAGSFVGSIRSIGRAAASKKSAVPTEILSPSRRSPTKVAAAVPLPSSPINIPSAVPALSLDLGPTGFMPQPFESSTETEHQQEFIKLTDPDNITHGLPDSGGLHVPAELEAKNDTPVSCNITLGGLLHISLPSSTLDFSNGQPPTPMPGTNLSLELDGQGADRSPVFERSAELADGLPERNGVGLRQMRSLDALARNYNQSGQADCAADSADSTDALAEAAEVAHKADESALPSVGYGTADLTVELTPAGKKHAETSGTPVKAMVENMRCANGSYVPSTEANPSPSSSSRPLPLASASLTRPSCHRDFLSATTVSTCPSDMLPVCPQSTPIGRDDDHGDVIGWLESDIHGWQQAKHDIRQEKQLNNEAEADLPVANSGPPSPTKSVKLPYRLKHDDSSPKEEERVTNTAASDTQRTTHTSKSAKSQSSYEPVVFRPYIDKLAAKKLGIFRPGSCPSLRKRYSADRVTLGGAFTPLTSQTSSRLAEPSPTPASDRHLPAHGDEAPKPLNVANDAESVITDYEEFKTQQIFLDGGNDIEFPDYEQTDSSPVGSPRNVAPLIVSPLYRAVTTSQCSSPTSARTTGIRGTDVGGMFWKFNVSSWLGGSQDVATDASIDGSSDTTEKAVSPSSPASADLHRTPSMGNRLEFDLKRSDRNMRYNALQIDGSNDATPASERPPSADFTFAAPQQAGDDDLQLAVFENAYADVHTALSEVSGHAKQSSLDRSDSSVSQGSTVRALNLAIRETKHAQLALAGTPEASFADESSPPYSPMSPAAVEIHLPEHGPFDSLRSSMDEPSDAVPTSSPLNLTAWERQALQIAMPSQMRVHARRVISSEQSPKRVETAHLQELSSSSPTGGVDSSGFEATSPMRDASRNFYAPLMTSSPPEVPIKARSPARKVFSSAKAPNDIESADKDGIPSSSPTGGIQSSGFEATSSFGRSSGKRFAPLAAMGSSPPIAAEPSRPKRQALGALTTAACDARDGASLVASRIEALKLGSSPDSGYEGDTNAGSPACAPSAKLGGFRPARYRSSNFRANTP